MENAGVIGLSRQIALQRAMDVVAQNVANVDTAGYKAEQVRFREVEMVTDPNDRIERKIDFVIDQGLVRDQREGGFERTGNPYSAAIAGQGFFAIQTANGTRYTRNGNFTVDNTGKLVTSEGRAVLDENDQTITIPQNAVEQKTAAEVVIAGDGTISGANGRIAKIKVVTFDKPQNLDRQDDSLYVAHAGNEPKVNRNPRVIQGMLEKSNVQPVLEMTRMIQIQRAYEGARNLVDAVNQTSQDGIRRLAQRGA